MAQRPKQRAQQQTAQRRRKALAEKADVAATSTKIDPVIPESAPQAVDEPDYERTDEVARFWDETDIELVEIALPGGSSGGNTGGNVGFTLRHYRTAMFYPEPEPEPEPEPDDFDEDFDLPDTVRVPDDEPDDPRATKKSESRADDNGSDGESEEPDFDEPEEPVGEEREEAVMLAHEGTLHVFRTARALVDFVTSSAPHDLSEVEAFTRIKQKLRPELVAPADEDRYELDLVVRNLRGGRDVWDVDLLISAAEIARDITYACRLRDALAALGPGSPLDALDDALRDGGFWARRRLRRIKAEQVALAWRGVIGKIAGAVQWH